MGIDELPQISFLWWCRASRSLEETSRTGSEHSSRLSSALRNIEALRVRTLILIGARRICGQRVRAEPNVRKQQLDLKPMGYGFWFEVFPTICRSLYYRNITFQGNCGETSRQGIYTWKVTCRASLSLPFNPDLRPTVAIKIKKYVSSTARYQWAVLPTICVRPFIIKLQYSERYHLKGVPSLRETQQMISAKKAAIWLASRFLGIQF